jgi:hypothetical protein
MREMPIYALVVTGDDQRSAKILIIDSAALPEPD